MKLFGSRSSTAVTRAPAGASGDGAGPGVLPSDASLVEMSFLDHLEEFRWSLLKGLGGVLLATIACSFFASWIIDVLLLGPTRPEFFMYKAFGIEALPIKLQNRTVTGQFFAYWGTVISVGLIIGSPIFVYYFWKFIEPGLYPSEKKGLRFSAVAATFFFILGILFGYCVITPLAIQFFANFSISDLIVNEWDINKYFGMVTFWAFGVGILFELPVVIYFLSKLGIVNPVMLRTGRRYAIVIILIMAAFLTPPDPISQVLVAIPLMLLYEGSIYVSAVVNRRREKELREALA